jgi:hypothetical protein
MKILHLATLTACIVSSLGVGPMASSAFAQEDEAPPLSSDRPGETTSPGVVPKGYVQWEAGFQWGYDEDDGTEIDTVEVLASTVRIGLSRRTELRILWLPYNVVAREAAAGQTTQRGAGDAAINAKVRLAEQNGARPEFALVAGVTLPVGSEGISSDEFDANLGLLFANGLTERLSFGYNLGITRATTASALGQRETNTELLTTGSLSIAAAPDVGVFVELYSTRVLGSDGSWSLSADTGVTWLVRPRIQLDLSVGNGLSDPDTDRFVGIGFTIRFPR